MPLKIETGAPSGVMRNDFLIPDLEVGQKVTIPVSERNRMAIQSSVVSTTSAFAGRAFVVEVGADKITVFRVEDKVEAE